jgi:hypothetical protein
MPCVRDGLGRLEIRQLAGQEQARQKYAGDQQCLVVLALFPNPVEFPQADRGYCNPYPFAILTEFC